VPTSSDVSNGAIVVARGLARGLAPSNGDDCTQAKVVTTLSEERTDAEPHVDWEEASTHFEEAHRVASSAGAVSNDADAIASEGAATNLTREEGGESAKRREEDGGDILLDGSYFGGDVKGCRGGCCDDRHGSKRRREGVLLCHFLRSRARERAAHRVVYTRLHTACHV